MDRQRILVVGAGFSGATIARELAETGSFEIDVIDSRNHVAGNAYDPKHPVTGHRYHKYGPHIFHTNSARVIEYLSRFTEWVDYRHRVRAVLDDGTSVPLPINIDTVNRVYNVALSTEAELREFLARIRVPRERPANAQEHLESIYGEQLTELFFGRYTRKMWDLDLRELPAAVVSRLPVRYDDNPYYFNDEFQMMPANGYELLVGAMLDHPAIRVSLNTGFDKSMEAGYAHVFNGMPIDVYFNEQFGPLPYRSIRFEHRTDEDFDHEVPTVNFTDTGKYTRKTDWSLYPGCGGNRGGLVTYEEPCSYEQNNLERYYPVKTVDGWPQERYQQYRKLAETLAHMTFIGRCGQYIYYDMHQVVANSLKIAADFLKTRTS